MQLWALQYTRDMVTLKRVQCRTRNVIKELEYLSYEVWLRESVWPGEGKA